MIPVTKPFSPPIEKYNELVKGIWQRNWFTNNGPLVNDLVRLVIGSAIGVLLYLISSFIFKMSSFTELKNLISKK
jgi:hypothetical protein